MANDTAKTSTINFVPVQGIFTPDAELVTLIGPAGTPFYAQIDPSQSGLHITDSTIDSTTIGATTPSTGVFTNISATTGSVSTEPVAGIDIANKSYVDNFVQGLNAKAAVVAATTENLASLAGLLTIDGVTLTAGQRVLVKNQTDSQFNGIYIAASGAWSRSADMNTWAEVPSAYMFVMQGDTQMDTSWLCTSNPGGTLDVTPITFVQFGSAGAYTAGTGLTLLANQFSITNTGVTAATKGSASKTVTATVNAQGQLTSLTDQDIAISTSQITSGVLSGTYGGTGVNNGSNTLTLGGSYTLNQSVASGASPSFVGANFSSIPNGALTNSSVTYNGQTVALGGSGTITAVNPYALTLGTGLSGTSYDGSAAVTAAIANTGVTATSYTYGNFTVNAQGQLTAASSNATTGTGNIVLSNSPTISGAWGSPDSITFDTTPTVPTTTGSLYWDSADGNQTLSLVMAGGNAVQQIGEETYYRIKASADITEGQVVMFTGTVGASGGLTGAPAIGLTASTASYIMGVATESIATNSWGYVTAFGLVRGINTTGGAESWVDGQILYYDPAVAGGLTKTLPTAPNAKVQVCAVAHAASNGSLFIRPSFGGTLGQYEGDVGFTSTAANNLIQRNAGNTAWTNVTPASITGVGSATNLAGGSAGYIPYQSGASTTSFLSAGTIGQVLTSNGTSAPTWTTPAGSVTVADDTTTNSSLYPLFANVTSGAITTEYVSSTKLQYNPSSGAFTASSFNGAGTGLTGTASSLSIGGNAATATSATSATSATTATNIAGGANGSVPYQTGSGATTFLAAGTNGYVLTLAGGVPSWAAAAGGVTLSDDTTTNATRYPLFAAATSGSVSTEYVSSTKYQYNPSTGALTAPELVASNGLIMNANTNTTSYSIASGQNAMSVGPFTTASGTTITVPSGSRWVIL